MCTHSIDDFEIPLSPEDGKHDPWLHMQMLPWPKWDSLTAIGIDHRGSTCNDGATLEKGWRPRKPKSQRPRRQQPKIDKQYEIALRRYKKHEHARDCVKAFLTAEKVKVPRRAHNKFPRFEDAQISRMDQKRFAEIRARIDDNIDGGDEQQSGEQEQSDSSIDDLLHDLQALDIKKQFASPPKSLEKRLTVASLIKELAHPALPSPLPRVFMHWTNAKQTPLDADQGRHSPPRHKQAAPATFATSVIRPGFDLTTSTHLADTESASSSVSSLSSSASFVTVPEGLKRPKNPFYAETLTFSQAMQHFIDILSAADKACRYWLPLSETRAMEAMTGATSAGSPMVRLQRDFEDVCHFLRTGREGWDLTQMPDNFFKDVGDLLASLMLHFECLVGYKGCGHVCTEVLMSLGKIKEMIFHWKYVKILLMDEEGEE